MEAYNVWDVGRCVRQSDQVASGQRTASRVADSGTEDRWRELPTGHPNGTSVTEPCLMTWPDRLSGDSQILPLEEIRDPRSNKEPGLPWTALQRQSKV